MPTQDLSREQALRILGPRPDFRPGPAENPISRGLPAGTVTDDTQQCLVIGRLLVEGGGRIEPRSVADALLGWEAEMAERGQSGLLGPSTRLALRAVAGGADPATTGGTGVTNGAAMRIAPIGIAYPPSPAGSLLEAVASACRVTHDTPVARAGSAAVAMAVSCGVEGMDFAAAVAPAAEAAAGASGGDGLGGRILDAVRRALSGTPLDALIGEFGTGVEMAQTVPMAFAVAALAPTDAWRAGVIAAGLGGDTDTIGAIAAAMVGACTGLAALPARAVATVRRVNRLDLEPLAAQLLELRQRAR